MKATKGNKSYSIDESQRKHYKDAGFDITDDTGEVLEHGRGKTVPYEAYESLKNEHLRLITAYEDLRVRYTEVVNIQNAEPDSISTEAESQPELETQGDPENEADPEALAVEGKKGKAANKKAGE